MSNLLRLSEHIRLKIISYGVPVIGFAAGITHFTLHTLFLEEYADFFSLYKNVIRVKVPEELETMLSQISDDLGIPVINPVTKLIAVIGIDTTHFGSTLTRSGALIGVPVTFLYKSKADVDQNIADFQIENKPVPWDSTDGQQLKESFVLSDLAKKFGIAYELALANTMKLYLHLSAAPLTILVYIQVNNYFCNAFGLPYRPFHMKSVFYVLLSLFGAGMYFSLKDLSTQYCEFNALDKVCEGGEEYIVGGIEFYEKLLQRNKALRNLFTNGRSDYNTYGDPIYFLRNKRVPLTAQKSLLEQKLVKLKENTNLQ